MEKVTPHTTGKVGPWVGHVLALGLLAAVVYVVFGQLLRAGFIVYDDPLFISENVPVSAGLGPGALEWALKAGFIHFSPQVEYWSPLVVLSRMLDFSLFGGDGGGHHLSSIVLHAINMALLYAAVFAFGRSRSKALAVALLFGVHPLAVEPVAWLSARKDLLAGTFSLLTFIAYGFYRARACTWRYLLLLATYGLAAMTKPIVMVVPALLLVLDFWPLKTPFSRRLLLEKLPLGLIAIGVAFLALKSQQGFGAMQALTAVGPGARLANLVANVGLYLRQWLWPNELSIFYPAPEVFPLGQLAAGVCVCLAASICAWRVRRRFPVFLAAWLWYLVALGPVLGVVGLGSSRLADRYMYLPMMGLAVAVVFFVPLAQGSWRRWAPIGALAGVILGLGVRSWQQVAVWRDSVSVFRHADALYPGVWLIGLNLGVALKEAGQFQEAVAQSVKLQRDWPTSPRIWGLLGAALNGSGHPNEALRCLDRALELEPGMLVGHLYRAEVLEKLGRLVEATQSFQEAVDLGAGVPNCYLSRGRFFERHAMWEAALEDAEKMLELWPHNPEYVLQAANIYYHAGNRRRALEILKGYQRAFRNSEQGSRDALRLAEEITGRRLQN